MESTLDRRSFLKMLALLPLLGAHKSHSTRAARAPVPGQDTPNLLILVFDALSAQHVSVYGYNRETTPNLARFADRATVYHRHYAAGNYTTPGVASILTGTYPWSHRALQLHGSGLITERYRDRNLFSALAARGYYTFAYTHNHNVATQLFQLRESLDLLEPTRLLSLTDSEVSDMLFPNDYEVAYWTEWITLHDWQSPPSSLFLSLLSKQLADLRQEKARQEYDPLFPGGTVPYMHTVSLVLEDAVDWLMKQVSVSAKPFLGYVHVLPPHAPYVTRSEFKGMFRDQWSPPIKPTHFFSMGLAERLLNRRHRWYDEYIAYTDAEFGRLYDSMLQSGALDNTCLIVTADHGEMFERGIWGHITETLYEPLIRVPLLISKPGQQRREDVVVPTSCVDLLPTFLQVAGQSPPAWCEGQILPGSGDEGDLAQRSIFAVEAKHNPRTAPLNKGTVALIKGPYKLIHYFGYPGHENVHELYDVESDPEELNDLSGRSIAGELLAELAERLAAANQPFASR